MKMKVLWVYEEGMLESQQHIIDHLRNNDCEVTLECVCFEKNGDRWGRFSHPAMTTKHGPKHYDFHIMSTHNGNPNVEQFQKFSRPRIGCIDIEHDLFHPVPERSPDRQSVGVFVFTKQHEVHLKQIPNIKKIHARWYKLDGSVVSNETLFETFPIKDEFGVYSPGADAVIIGSNHWPWPEVPEMISRCFHYVWYKPYHALDNTMRGSVRLPGSFENAQGVNSLNRVSRFWFTFESSCFVEALLYGCIPILCSDAIIERERVSEYIDVVKIIANRQAGTGQFRTVAAVTLHDWKKKFSALQRDLKAQRDVYHALRSFWFHDDVLSWPTVHEQLLHEMRVAYKKVNPRK